MIGDDYEWYKYVDDWVCNPVLLYTPLTFFKVFSPHVCVVYGVMCSCGIDTQVKDL